MHPETIYLIVRMCNLESFKIDLKALPQGKTSFGYVLDDQYFEAIDAPEIRKGDLTCLLTVNRTAGIFKLLFETHGVVHVPCDVCLDDMELPVDTNDRLVVKLGEGNSESDDIVTIDENEGILDVSWFIFECIDLYLPIRHVHAPGKCNPAMIERLKEFSAARSGEEDDAVVDSRWEALLKIKQ